MPFTSRPAHGFTETTSNAGTNALEGCCARTDETDAQITKMHVESLEITDVLLSDILS
jgi:hypothetical protein